MYSEEEKREEQGSRQEERRRKMETRELVVDEPCGLELELDGETHNSLEGREEVERALSVREIQRRLCMVAVEGEAEGETGGENLLIRGIGRRNTEKFKVWFRASKEDVLAGTPLYVKDDGQNIYTWDMNPCSTRSILILLSKGDVTHICCEQCLVDVFLFCNHYEAQLQEESIPFAWDALRRGVMRSYIERLIRYRQIQPPLFTNRTPSTTAFQLNQSEKSRLYKTHLTLHPLRYRPPLMDGLYVLDEFAFFVKRLPSESDGKCRTPTNFEVWSAGNSILAFHFFLIYLRRMTLCAALLHGHVPFRPKDVSQTLGVTFPWCQHRHDGAPARRFPAPRAFQCAADDADEISRIKPHVRHLMSLAPPAEYRVELTVQNFLYATTRAVFGAVLSVNIDMQKHTLCCDTPLALMEGLLQDIQTQRWTDFYPGVTREFREFYDPRQTHIVLACLDIYDDSGDIVENTIFQERYYPPSDSDSDDEHEQHHPPPPQQQQHDPQQLDLTLSL